MLGRAPFPTLLEVDASARIRKLQATPLFGGVGDDVVSLLLSRAEAIDVPGGDWFLREGERATALFWLESGTVSISRKHGDREIELRRLSAGEVFGEMAIFDFGPRSASVCAAEDCRALRIGCELLSQILAYDLEQYTLLTLNLARELARRLRWTQNDLLVRGGRWDDERPPPCV
jgi:CRP-like cAMP-binding protein